MDRRVQKKLLNALLPDSSVPILSVFGSFAKGRERRHSDIDIGLALSQPLSWKDKVRFRNIVEKALGRNADIIDLRIASGLILEQALCSGIPLIKKIKISMPSC